MSRNEPVDPAVRLAISRWTNDAPRGAVSTICVELGISRKTFYLLRARALSEGSAAARAPLATSPLLALSAERGGHGSGPVQVRAALESFGLDHGPVSVHERMKTMGLVTRTVASLPRIFCEWCVARVEPRKRPRAVWQRFVYTAPNGGWQLDATQYVFTRGRTCVIFQLQDDHSRLAIASHVVSGETADAAVAVFTKGATLYGTPHRLLTDSGAALTPSRRGHYGKLVDQVIALGVEAITGEPYRPTTQGKSERFHQILFRWLDKHPIAESLQGL